MSKVAILIADGCEECEALIQVDMLRRAKIDIDMVSVSDSRQVTSARNITFICDRVLSDLDPDAYDGVILPGGMPGTTNLKENPKVISLIKKYNAEKKLVAAICAAPTVLGYAGILKGRNATCYPGMEDGLTGALKKTDPVVRDGNVITSRGLGTALSFAGAIIEYFTDQATAKDTLTKVVYKY
ncbi:MAG: DJ-1/PfpI family protein [Lachnospiraceae bacterium]|uniref:DJ-1/PfpI family protein n=1 Tax=Candidatus Weimeria bifida TaxID=2599074 RepID=A0A6N7IX55_9FIRM|nr:DJ-1/PfpI family protein [Candidatus Weimeria bifida]RRF96246.1 MAG: DJ-1/PfpI family protein [Lachnospiraceae bacterium]